MFFQRRHTNGQQAHKKILNVSDRGMQIQMPMRYHLTLVRMTIIKKSINKFWRACGEKKIFLHCSRRYKLVWLLWKNRMEISLKTKNGTIIWYGNPTPGIPIPYLEKKKTIFQKDMCIPMFTAIFAIAKSLQSCLTLCDRIDGSPPGFPVPGIL